ncbi:universal stress protein [Oceanisphaera profunda]|uniref:Universal stress protein n=1 Tax=Oceanisphaera profunda TaxID=1416627 RepID=A0A1Y0D3Q3_9GAMM|nr:universal stress protein [Oceanisphaera profunda]ART81847.1 universal stress protein [Oceanisphaera profunda]
MYKSLLVAIDGSKQSEKALTLACHLARQDDAQVHIVHAPQALQHPAMMTWGIGSVSLDDSREELEVTGNKIVERAIQEASALGVAHVQGHVVRGEPAHAIIQEAQKLGVDVIVLGCRGLGNLEGMALGSISHKVNHSAKCGVITVR